MRLPYVVAIASVVFVCFVAVPPSHSQSPIQSSASPSGAAPIRAVMAIKAITADPVLHDYWNGLRLSLLKSWEPLLSKAVNPATNRSGDSTIRVTVHSDGEIRSMILISSSHDDDLNRSCWGAITSLGQLPALPGTFSGTEATFEVRFTLNEPDATPHR